MAPEAAPEGAGHTFVVAKLVLPSVGSPAAELVWDSTEKTGRRRLVELRGQDLGQDPFLQVRIELENWENAAFEAQILNTDGVEQGICRIHSELVEHGL